MILNNWLSITRFQKKVATKYHSTSKAAKRTLLLLVVSLLPSQVIAQGRFGIQCSPGVAFSSTRPRACTSDTSLKIAGGVTYDWAIHEKHYIGTGLFFVHRGINWKLASETSPQKYTTSYLQLPFLLKLFTGEILLDTRLFFPVGLIAGIRLAETNDGPEPTIEGSEVGLKNKKAKFKRAICALSLGMGIEHEFAEASSIFGSIDCQIGLWNIIADTTTASPAPNNNKLTSLTNNSLSLNIGLRF